MTKPDCTQPFQLHISFSLLALWRTFCTHICIASSCWSFDSLVMVPRCNCARVSSASLSAYLPINPNCFHQTVATQTLTHHLTVIPQANEAAHKPSKKRFSPHKASSASTNVPPAKETRFLLAIPEGSQALDHGLRIRDSSGGLLKVSTKGGF